MKSNRFLHAHALLFSMTLISPALADDAWTEQDRINVEKSVAREARPEADTQRDGDRKPAEVLTFFQIKPGMIVADLMAGGGYYTELVSHVVGDQGKVFLHNTPAMIQRFAGKAVTQRMSESDLANVERVDSELEDPGFEAGSLDAALLFLFYHDTYWMGVDRPKMNAAIYDALKPGGVYCVIDHHAEAGSGQRDVQTLHRVDADIVKTEILAAGFELDAESDVLKNEDDARKTSVFGPGVRGKTDRFVYRFRKPLK